jgi:hypothetical protein
MAANIKGLRMISEIGNAGIPELVLRKFGYVTNDDAATVQTANYFLNTFFQFRKGDQIDVSMDVDAAVVYKSYVVSAVSATAATLTLQTTT